MLSQFLACVLQTGAPAPEIAGGSAYELEEPLGAFDVMASPDRQREMLLALGWDEGLPTVSQLTSHILDRLESECACDVACEDGAAGDALSAGGGDGGAAPTCAYEAGLRDLGI